MSDFAKDKRWLLEINESGKFVVFGNLVSPERDYILDVSELPEAKAIKIVGLLCALQETALPQPYVELSGNAPVYGKQCPDKVGRP